jgi:peroxiredoxin
MPLRAMMVLVLLVIGNVAAAGDLAFRTQEIFTELAVGYATHVLDVNDDRRPDVLVVDTKRVIWFENPTWQMHTILAGGTLPDNVSIAPADIDGDGKLDFALAADWRPGDTRASGTIQWIRRGASPEAPWSVHPIGVEPTAHRIRFADLDGNGREELIVVPLFGRGSTPPQFAEAPLRILAYEIPADPVVGPWKPTVINEELHVAHNFWPADLDRDGRLDLLVASFEGVSLLRRGADGGWTRTLLGSGNQETRPNRGASEIKHGSLDGGRDYLATIEPWHGFQVVVYTPPASNGRDAAAAVPLWTRHVLDEQLKWGHAVWCANLDGDADQELVIGVRDTKDADDPCGVRVYDPAGGAAGTALRWNRQLVDPAGVAVEDLAVADLNADGRQDIVAVGRQTRNVRIYWNETGDEYPPETLKASDGSELSLGDARGRAATVIMCMSVECPISNEFLPAIQELAARYEPQGVRVIGINPNAGETLEAMAEYARQHQLRFPFVKDDGGKVSRRLLFSVTPEARVFDRAGKIVYQGRIDDRYRAGGGRPGAEIRPDLARALDELLAGERITQSRTRPVGCPIQHVAK